MARLADMWSMMPVPPGLGELESQETEHSAGADSIRIALDSDGCRHLLVPAKGEVAADTRSRGVMLVPQSLLIAGVEQQFADLVCADATLQEVYTELCEDACRRIAQSDDPPDDLLRSTLQEWRELLRQGSSSVDRSAVIGLRGELEVLRRLAEASPGDALEAWRGPAGGTFDFQRSELTLEVKTTTAQDGRNVTIHGLRQLDPPAGHSLHLAFVRLQADDLGESCAMLVEDLKTLGVDQERLAELLGGAGYSDTDDVAWTERFSTLEVDIWPVGPDFPGLRSASLDPAVLVGVSNVAYSLDLDAVGPPVPVEEELSLLRRLAGES